MKQNFVIKAKEDVVEIDIFGDIGEGWFSEDGNTIQSVKEDLRTHKGKPLIINVASLGGDVNDGLGIHDMIRMHGGKTTARIYGMTASAGTIVALGADNVEISENSLFLIHNSWGMTVGNAKDHRANADDLDKIDSRMGSIYRKKARGKQMSQIFSLMEQEKWIDADEAIEWGFVDKKIKAKKVAAAAIKAIMADKNLPNLPKTFTENSTDMNTKELNAAIEASEKSIIGKMKDMFASLLDKGTPKAEIDEAVIQDAVDRIEAVRADLQDQIDASNEDEEVTEDEEANEEAKKELAEKEAELTEAKEELETATAEKEKAEAEVARLKAKKVKGKEKKDEDEPGGKQKSKYPQLDVISGRMNDKYIRTRA